MNDENPNIPLLEDLITPGQSPHDDDTVNDHHPLESDHVHANSASASDDLDDDPKDDIKNDANLKELIIDEEIRMILDKHMDNAYDEIIRLLNRRIC